MTPERLRFYKSQAWKHTAADYARSQNYLCEICKAQGLITSGEFVHHKIHLNEENFSDPEISLSWSNLQLVCRRHHAELHRKNSKRYFIDDTGHVFCDDTSPPDL